MFNKYTICLTCLFLLVIQVSDGQYNLAENKVWMFGQNSGFDFNTGLALNSQINASECSNSVCDNAGNLLFYTDGFTIWNRNHIPMAGANPLFPGLTINATQSTGQGALIVGLLQGNSKYYVFSLTAQETQNPGGGKLYYSVIDMTLNGGLGDVVPGQSLVLLDSGFSEHMVAVPTCFGVWVLLHDRVSPVFKAFKVTSGGIEAPVISTSGMVGNVAPTNPLGFTGNNFYITGQLAASSDYSELAATYFKGNIVEMYDFDKVTGLVSNSRIIDNSYDPYSFYGVSFSPDNLRLYVSNCTPTISNKGFFQYNLNLPTVTQITNSRYKVGTNNAALSQMQLGPDGKIYFNGNYISKMGVISFPNLLTSACGFDSQGISLSTGTNAMAGFHNTFAKPSPPPSDTFKSIRLDTMVCITDSITISVPSGATYISWEDGATNVERKVGPGKHWVSYIQNCNAFVDSFRIGVRSGEVELGPDTLSCGSLILYPQITDAQQISYLWQDGSTSDHYQVNQTGLISLIANIDGCLHKDSVKVTVINLIQSLGNDLTFCNDVAFNIPLSISIPENGSALWSTGQIGHAINASHFGVYSVTISHPACGSFSTQITIDSAICNCQVLVPSAFTPNGDGINDQFQIAYENGCEITGYMVRIFNRWGQCVYSSYQANRGWDGRFNGTNSEAGTYFYEVSFYKGSNKIPFLKRGDLALLR